MSLIIVVPKERSSGERRVALDPSCAERLVQMGAHIRIESGCGNYSGFHDEDYQGASVCHDIGSLFQNADVIVKVVCPSLDDIDAMPPGCTLICMVSPFQHLEEVERLRGRKVTVLAMDLMPRVTRAQPMDALSSQATVAGYKAALLAAELSPRLFPMLTTAAGTIRPSRVLIIGAGVAGLQAIATARRLGAHVEAYDIRKAAKEQIESLGARMIDIGVEAEGSGGFARALRREEKQKQHDALAEHVAQAHVVICAASIPGRPAPMILTQDMVERMMPQSVIVDLAAPTGGNCELTQVGSQIYHNEVLIVGPLNLPSHGSVNASEMYARNVFNLLTLITRDQELVLDQHDDIIARCVVCHDGAVNHGPTAALMGLEHTPFPGAAYSAVVEFPDDNAGWLDTDESDPLVANDPPIANDESALASDSVPGKGTLMHESRVDTNIIAESPPSPPLGGPQSLPGTSEDRASDAGAAAEVVQPSSAGGPEPLKVDHESHRFDPLVEIDGIGPALQERLYAFGYRCFADLADLDALGAEQLAAQLELESGTELQHWADQARRLMEGSEP